ncbi:MAG: MFS transporter [Acidimicrobiales bacterium]
MKSAAKPSTVLAVVSLGVFVVNLDTTVLFIAFDDLRESFPEASSAELSWVINAYSIVFAALLVPAGRIADRRGRDVVLEASLVIFTAASALAAVAPTVSILIAARVLQAVGSAGLVPSSLGLVMRAYPAEKRATAVTLWAGVGSAAAALGPSLGALIVELAGWRAAFVINIPVGIVGFILAKRILSEPPADSDEPIPSPIGVVLIAVAVGLIALGFVQSDTWGWSDPRTIAAIVGGLLVLALFVLQTTHAKSPAVDLSLFKVSGFRWANLGILVYMTAFGNMFFGWILFTQQVWGYSTIEAGLAVTPTPLIVAASAPSISRTLPTLGWRTTLVPAGVLYGAGGLWLLVFADAEPAFLTALLPATIITGIATAFLLPGLNSAAVQALPPNRFAVGAGVSQANRNLGLALGVALVVSFVGDGTSDPDNFDQAWYLQVAGGLVVAAIASQLGARPAAPASSESTDTRSRQ